MPELPFLTVLTDNLRRQVAVGLPRIMGGKNVARGTLGIKRHRHGASLYSPALPAALMIGHHFSISAL